MFLVTGAACGGNSYEEIFAGSPLGSGGSSYDDGGVSGTGGVGKQGGAAGRSGTGGSTSVGGSAASGGSADTGGGAGTGATTDSGGGAGAGGSLGSGGTQPDAGESCADLLRNANALLAEAQICTGNSTTECQSSAVGYCNCPVLVASPDSAATSEYLKALGKYNTRCPHACPLVLCPTPTGKCGPASTGGGARQCVRTGSGPAAQ
jgi:hypothetical protein